MGRYNDLNRVAEHPGHSIIKLSTQKFVNLAAETYWKSFRSSLLSILLLFPVRRPPLSACSVALIVATCWYRSHHEHLFASPRSG